MSERASIFGDDLDVADFTPRKPSALPDKDAIRVIAESIGFESREPVERPSRVEETAPRRQQRRHTTGRNRQLNIKATEATVNRFYAIADAQGWVLGEAFECAIAALEREIGRG